MRARHLFTAALLALASCATTAPEVHEQAAAAQARADSAARANWHAPAAPLSPRKVKGDYTVIYQVAGPGGSNSAAPTTVSRTSAPVAAGPAAHVAAEQAGGPGWWGVLLSFLAGAVGWPLLRARLARGLPWLARPSLPPG